MSELNFWMDHTALKKHRAKKTAIAFAASISLAAFTIVSAEEQTSDLRIISQYVVRQKHWPANVFRVERADCDCAYAFYRIIYLPEADKPVTANSKSFAVYYDEQLHKVVKETPFQ